MNISIVLAQILGIILLGLGLSMALNKKWLSNVIDEFVKNHALVWLGGFIALIMGGTIVVLNNLWTSGVQLIVTILGWLILIKGILILIIPGSVIAYYRKINTLNIFVWGGIIVSIVGLLLLIY